MIEAHRRWMNILKNWGEGYGRRRHDDNPYPPFLHDHQKFQNFLSFPFRIPKRDRQLRQDLDNRGEKGELTSVRKGLKTS